MMRAIDTNVLVRILIKDDENQSKKALKYVKKHGEVFISLIVLCETIWVCKDCYDLNKDEIIQVINHILRTDQFIVDYSEVVWSALSEYKRVSIDFADCLIGAIAKFHSYLPVGTFDKKAKKSEYFEHIS